MSISKIKEKSLTTGAVTDANFDKTVITDQTLLDESANDADVLLIYDASAGALKKVLKSNVGIQVPTLSSVSPTNVNTGDGTGNATFTITGTNFVTGTTAKLLTSSSSDVAFDSVTRDSATQLTCVIAISSLSNANEPYGVQVLGGNGLNTAVLSGQVNINAQPVYTTTAGSLGSSRTNMSGISVNATDPESAGNVTFELQSGSLPPGISLVNTAAEGGTATFSGTFSSLASSDTVYNFTLRAVDAASNTNSRAFSFTALGLQIESFTSSGTFSVPSGLTSVDVLVVAGGGGGGGAHNNGYGAGGGGAGGLIFMPSYPVTPGGTVSVTVGCGGAGKPGGTPGQPISASFGTVGQDSVFGTLTAKGGGGGGGFPGCGAQNSASQGSSGGSGGGGGGENTANSCGSPGTQPTQPGNSGAYGFGNPGGGKNPSYDNAGGGGGGAGAAGGPVNGTGQGGPGGVGKAYTIADGTTPVYYAGGGGGSGAGSQGGIPFGQGGQGGGATGSLHYNQPNARATGTATANRGGGGGGASSGQASAPADYNASPGGKGIVIVSF